MSASYSTSPRQRALSAIAALCIVGGGAAALVFGLAARMAGSPSAPALEAIVTAPTRPPPPPPPPQPKQKATSSATKGRPSPRNLKNKAAQVFAPRVMPLAPPPPLIAVPLPGTGNAAQTGASDRLGPGTGAGGIGNGEGGGGNGDGLGGDDTLTRPRQIRGRLRFSDLPPDLREARAGGELEVTYRIGVDGRVSECRVTQSSGRPSLDRKTCELITERFRFRPSRDRSGRPVASYMIERHGWFLDPADDDLGE